MAGPAQNFALQDEIVNLRERGYSVKAIAETLGRAPRVIKHHLANHRKRTGERPQTHCAKTELMGDTVLSI